MLNKKYTSIRGYQLTIFKNFLKVFIRVVVACENLKKLLHHNPDFNMEDSFR
jgi:hypothetical protein